MLQRYRIIQDAARHLAGAANGTVKALIKERVKQEPHFTDRMLGRIELAMEGHSHHGVRWTAKTLTDHGPNTEEATYGADFFGVLDIDLPGYSVNKGFLCQAKLVEPDTTFRSRDFDRLYEQCQKMLRLSSSSFVFLYSRLGISVVPAQAVVASDRTNPHSFYSRSISKFYEEHFASFFGDPRVNLPQARTLERLAEQYESRSGLSLEATLG